MLFNIASESNLTLAISQQHAQEGVRQVWALKQVFIERRSKLSSAVMHNTKFTGSVARMMWYVPHPVRFVVFLRRHPSSVSIADQTVDFYLCTRQKECYHVRTYALSLSKEYLTPSGD